MIKALTINFFGEIRFVLACCKQILSNLFLFIPRLSFSWEAFPQLTRSYQLTSAVWLSSGEMIVFGNAIQQGYGYHSAHVEMLTWPVPMVEGTDIETPKCARRTVGGCPVRQTSSLSATRCHNRAIVNFDTSTYIFIPPSEGLHQGQWTNIANASYNLKLCYSRGHLYGIGMFL